MFFCFLLAVSIRYFSGVNPVNSGECGEYIEIAKKYKLNLYLNNFSQKNSINVLEVFDEFEELVNELKNQKIELSFGPNFESKYIFSKKCLISSKYIPIYERYWNRYPIIRSAAFVLSIIAFLALFTRYLPCFYRNPLPKFTRFQNDTFIFNNNFKILTQKSKIGIKIDNKNCLFNECSYVQIRYFLDSNSIHKFFVLPFSKFINLGLTAHCFLFDVEHNVKSVIQKCELNADENITSQTVGISHSDTHEITLEIPNQSIKIYSPYLTNPTSSKYYFHCNVRLVIYSVLTEIMLKPPGIDMFIYSIGTIYDRVDFDAFGFFCEIQAGIEVIEFCTKDQEINKVVLELLQKYQQTQLKIYRRKHYIIYISMLRLGRNNYYTVGVIDTHRPIIYSIEEPFATLALLLSLLFHLNISASEDSKTLLRVHSLFKKIGAFGLFEFYGDTKDNIRKTSSISGWSIQTTEELLERINEAPYDSNDPYICRLKNNQWVGIHSRVEHDYIKSHYVRTVLVEDLTRMKKVCDKEQDIHEKELQLQKLLAIHVFAADSNCMDESFSKELGYSRELNSIFDIIYPDDAGIFSKYFSTPNWIVFRLKNNNGEYIWYSSYQNCIFNIHDSLSQPASEFAIDLDETLMAAAGNYINLYAIDLKTDEIITAFAPKDYVPHTAKGFAAYYEPSFRTKFEINYAKVKSGEQTSLHFLALVEMMDKTYGWYDTVIERHENDTVAFAFILVDYEKRFKDQLIDAKSVIDLALFHSNVVHWEFENDDEQELVFTSRPVTYKPVQLNLTSLVHNVSSDCLMKVREIFDRALIDGEPFEVEVSMIFEKMRWILFRGRKNNDNLSGVYFDLTELRENELLLEQQRQKALEASNAKSMFLANMTHEIRTPMGGMLSLLDLLMQTQLNEEQFQMMKVVKDSFNRLMEMLNDTLDIAKIDQNRMKPSFVVFHLADFLRTTFINLAQQVNPNVHFIVDVDAEFPLMFYGDPHFLMRICHNLLSNAIKFTEKGSINVSYRLNEENGGFDVIVSDTGIGIQKSKLSEIFETFSQGDSSVTRHYGGSGIGLSLISKLLKLIDGWVKVESVPNVGSTFTAHFPYEIACVPYIHKNLKNKKCYVLDLASVQSYVIVFKFALFYGLTFINTVSVKKSEIKLIFARNEEEANNMDKDFPGTRVIIFTENRQFNEKVTHEVMTEPILPSKLRHLFIEIKKAKKVEENEETTVAKVLAAEDNKINQLVIQKLLTKLKLDFKVVSNGQEVLDVLKEEKFDLILMDQHMPVMDGIEATKIIRASDAEYSKIPIIALTASTLQEDLDECMAAGMNHFLVKPVSADSIDRVVKEYKK